MKINENNNAPACAQKVVEVTKEGLPLSCPPRDKRVWDAHPRVYLPIAEIGEVICPYCGTHYILKADILKDETKKF